MITDINLFHDVKRNLFFIAENWRGIVPASFEKILTFKENPFSEFKQLTGIDFAGTVYAYKKSFIAVNYPGRPEYCRWVLFKKEDGQDLNDVLSFIVELDDSNSLPNG